MWFSLTADYLHGAENMATNKMIILYATASGTTIENVRHVQTQIEGPIKVTHWLKLSRGIYLEQSLLTLYEHNTSCLQGNGEYERSYLKSNSVLEIILNVKMTKGKKVNWMSLKFKLLYIKGHCQESLKTVYEMRENICKSHIW